MFSVGNLQLFVRKLQLCVCLAYFFADNAVDGGGPGKAPAANA